MCHFSSAKTDDRSSILRAHFPKKKEMKVEFELELELV